MTRAARAPISTPRICLRAEIRPGSGHLADIATALATTRAVTLVLAPPVGRTVDRDAAAALVALAQARNVAALIVDDLTEARATKADGVHLTWSPEIAEAYAKARATLGPEAIVGAEAGRSRHDAMLLGEAGADYVAFGLEGASGDQQDLYDARLDLVAWWADLFEVPLVAFDVETPREAEALSQAGADFLALTMPAEFDGDGPEAWAAPLLAATREREDERT